MTKAIKIGANERKVLRVLANHYGDFGCFGFRALQHRTRLKRAEVRRACRSLRRKGLAEFARALRSDDGEPRGSGYGATKAGVEFLSA
jgi:DNA-binding MurR/RpiR family transcriptional regulator